MLKEDWNDEEYCLQQVKQNGYSIQYIKNPSEQVQLEAVKQNGNSIRYINISEEDMKKIKEKYPEYFI